ncbi:MAG: hypothetical protein E7611_06675 [Ruminococcaceae bacterium]|nr:hypothetical protein [Oscillospiraceae bacterium]
MATKTTKRALIVSVLSLFICFTMLLGTTYAWFTDSVTSAGNIIKTGTLDVSLEYKTPIGISGDWVDASTGAIFNHDNWEPGYTQVRYVKIENEGSLDLKFILNIIPNTATAPGEVNLADVIEVYMMPVADATSLPTVDRTALTTSSTAYKGTLAAIMAEDDGAAHGVLYAKDNADAAANKNYVEVYAIVLKMSESAGNEYQNKSVGGGFVVQLLATQLASESDDLGNDYDNDAEYPEVALDNVTKEENVAASVEAEDVAIDIPAGAPAGNYSLEVSEKNVKSDDNGNTTISMDIELKHNGGKVDGNYDYTVSVDIGANLNLTKVIHDGVELDAADYSYDFATGILTFTVNNFSPFAFVYDEIGTKVDADDSVEDIKSALSAGGIITLDSDIELDEIVMISEHTVINGNGHKVISSANRVFRVTTSDIEVVLNDVNMVSNAVMVYPNDVRGISIDSNLQNVVLTLNNCSVDFTDDSACDWSYAINDVGNGTGHKLTVNGGTYEGANVINMHGANNTIVVKNATLNSIYLSNGSYGACIWAMTDSGSTVEAVGNVYNGENAIAYNIGSNTLVEEGNTDNTGILLKASGSKGYYSLAEAVEKASDGATLYFVRDIESVDGVVITDKNLTLDLDGHTYTVSEGASTNNRNFKINGTSVVTIKNGTLVAEGELTSGAYGTVRTEDSANVTLEGLKLYSYRGYGLNIKALSGTTVTINDCEIYAQYSGGVEAAGGTIELTNVKIEQNGVYSGAAWCSVAIGVNGGGKVVVNSGTYSAKTIETDANAAQGTWVAYVMSSGGTLEINGGTFNGFVAETANAANACGVICADRAAVVNIYGGTFNSNGAILDMRNNVGTQPNPVATIYGGTFSADPMVSGLYSSNLIKAADGHIVVENADGTYSAMEGVVVSTAAELMAAISNGASTIWIVEGADLTGFQRTVINKSLTIYGNGASLTADEDFAIEFHNGKQYPFADDVTLTIYDLNDVCVWGSRCSEYAFNLNLNNCDDCRIFVMGTTGANNIYMNDCDVTREGIGQDTAIYSNSNDSIVVEDCTFTGIECVFNLNHKVAGAMNVTVTRCDFIDCATTGAATYYAPIRLCNSVAGATQTLNVSGCTFVYTDGNAAVNGADVLLNADGSAAGTIIANVQSDAVVKNGENVTFN